MDRIIKEISKMSGHYHAIDIFRDWVEMTAISIGNQCYYNQSLEDKYLGIARKYSDKELLMLCEMSGILVALFDEDIQDYLGAIYMGLNAGNKKTGQFFTPFHICELMAQTSLSEYKGEEIVVNEPSSGGGGNILACAKVLKEKGYNYQEKMKVVAQDLDFQCVYMSYVQFSICGLNAVVIQGDTLKNENNIKLYTPVYLLREGGVK